MLFRSDTATGPRFTPYETQPGIMDDASITPTQLEDIYAQHDTMQVNTSFISEQDDPHEELSLSSTGPSMDKLESPQAQPEVEVHQESKHE